MKNLISFILLLTCLQGFGQIKFSDLPTFLGKGDSVWVPAVVNGVNRKLYGRDLAKEALSKKLDSTLGATKYGVDTAKTRLTNAITSGLNRSNHTGTQAISTVAGLHAALDAKAAASDLTSHTSNTSNPHSVTKTQVGLSNVDNTSDANKLISTATQTALNLKEATANKGQANGYAPLNSSTKVDLTYLPEQDFLDKLKQITGWTTTGTLVLKTVNGTIQWVAE